MARVLGEAGNYVSQEANRYYRRMLATGMFALGATCWLSGFALGGLFHRMPWWLSSLIQSLVLVVVFWLKNWGFKRIEELSRERNNYISGARGEKLVGYQLADFPEGYFVINDLKVDDANLDSVVIGPTGIFAIDVKNWRGVVSSAPDKKYELFLNGHNHGEDLKQFVGRVMKIRERVEVLAQETDFYIQPVFVFTSAQVKARWGETGNVHCMSDDKLYDYIVEAKTSKKLSKVQIDTLKRAFAALARMDPDFVDKVSVNKRQVVPQPGRELEMLPSKN